METGTPGGGDRIQPKMITLNRLDGVPPGEFSKVIVGTFDGADAVMNERSETAPKFGPGHRVSFEVIYSDGARYGGMFRLNHRSTALCKLSSHMTESILTRIGMNRPPEMSTDDYQEYLLESDFGGERFRHIIDFVMKYETGEPVPEILVQHFNKEESQLAPACR